MTDLPPPSPVPPPPDIEDEATSPRTWRTGQLVGVAVVALLVGVGIGGSSDDGDVGAVEPAAADTGEIADLEQQVSDLREEVSSLEEQLTGLEGSNAALEEELTSREEALAAAEGSTRRQAERGVDQAGL